jgi:hypothetical protein
MPSGNLSGVLYMAFNGRQIIARKSCCFVFKLTGQALKRHHQFNAGAVARRLHRLRRWRGGRRYSLTVYPDRYILGIHNLHCLRAVKAAQDKNRFRFVTS